MKSKSKTDRKSDFPCARKTQNFVVLLSGKNARSGSKNAQTVRFLLWLCVFASHNVHFCVRVVLSGMMNSCTFKVPNASL